MASFMNFSAWTDDIFAVIVLCSLFSILALFNHRYKSLNNQRQQAAHGDVNAPGPPAWPILGHLHLMKNNEPLHQTLWSLAQRYGRIMHLQFGCQRILVVSSSDLARECLTKYDKIFASRPRFAAGEHLGYNHTVLGLDPYGHTWRTLRKISTTKLLCTARMEMLKHIWAEEVSKVVRSLFESCTLQKGDYEKVNMRSKLLELSFSIIMRMVTDQQYLGNPGDLEQFRDIIKENSFLLGVFNAGDYIPLLRWLDLHGYERAMKNLHRRRDSFLQRLVDDHRRGQKKSSNFIDALIDLIDPSDGGDSLVKATATSITNAATDTTSSTMEWALSEMVRHPDVCKKVQEELDEKIGRDRILQESDIPKLGYLQATVKETLRLYSPPLLVPHMSTEACRVGGYYVPAGTRLLVNAWAIQRDPTDWERPLEFEPERFLKNKSIDVKGQDFKYIPFGSGRRACPGTSLAMRVVELSLGRLLQSFDWSVEGEIDMTEGLGLTLPRAVPLEATIRPRLPHCLYYY